MEKGYSALERGLPLDDRHQVGDQHRVLDHMPLPRADWVSSGLSCTGRTAGGKLVG